MPQLPRRLLPALAAAAAGAASLAASTWDTIMESKRLRVGAAPSEPWYYKDNTKSSAPGGVTSGDTMWRGIGPRVGELIARAMNVQLELVEVTWGTAVAALQSGQMDTMFILDPTPERALAVDFVASPVLWYPLLFVVREGVEVKNWSDLNDPAIRTAVVLGTSNDQTLGRLAPKANVQRFPSNGELFAAYQANKADVLVTTGPTADLTIPRLRNARRVLPHPLVAVPAGAAARKDADQRWNAYLSTCVAYFYNGGMTQQIYEEYMAFRGVDPAKATPIQRELW